VHAGQYQTVHDSERLLSSGLRKKFGFVFKVGRTLVTWFAIVDRTFAIGLLPQARHKSSPPSTVRFSLGNSLKRSPTATPVDLRAFDRVFVAFRCLSWRSRASSEGSAILRFATVFDSEFVDTLALIAGTELAAEGDDVESEVEDKLAEEFDAELVEEDTVEDKDAAVTFGTLWLIAWVAE